MLPDPTTSSLSESKLSQCRERPGRSGELSTCQEQPTVTNGAGDKYPSFLVGNPRCILHCLSEIPRGRKPYLLTICTHHRIPSLPSLTSPLPYLCFLESPPKLLSLKCLFQVLSLGESSLGHLAKNKRAKGILDRGKSFYKSPDWGRAGRV